MLRHVAKHSKQRKTTKLIKLQWIASIWCQNGLKSQNYKRNQITMNCIDLMSERSKIAKLQKQSNYNELHWFDVKTFKTFELGRKTFKTAQNYKRNQITMNCIDLASERSKMLRYVAKLQKWSYYDEFASIWRQNDHNNAKLRKWSNYNALHQFAVKTI